MLLFKNSVHHMEAPNVTEGAVTRLAWRQDLKEVLCALMLVILTLL